MVDSGRRWRELKINRWLILAELDIRNGYKKGVKVPCIFEHLGGMFYE